MKTVFIKNRAIYSITIILSGLISFGFMTPSYSIQDEDKISAHEKKFAATLSSDENVVKLIGCRIFEIEPEFRDTFKIKMEAHKEEREEMEKHIYFAEDFSYFRMYYPLNSLIIDCNGAQYTADEKGIVSLPDSCDISKIKAVGIKKSDSMTGSPTRDTLPDRILLDPELVQGVTNGIKTGYSHQKEKICVFIFTKKWSM
jgi:hypothetical protein